MAQPTYEELLAQLAKERAEKQKLEQLIAEQAGSGAIAQGTGNVAAGAGGAAIGGDFQGNLYIGAAPRNEAEALAIYRRTLVAGCRHLPLRGVDIGAADPKGEQKQIDLDQVYVGLDTTTRVQAGERKARSDERTQVTEQPLSALDATIAKRRLVLLGDPGSGKSTFVNHLSLCLAAHGLEPDARWLQRLGAWPAAEADLVPIPVILRDFARTLPATPSKAQPRQLWDFIAARLKEQNLEFAAEPLHTRLEGGRAIVLFDGLDEIPSAGQRAAVRDAVSAFAQRYAQARMLVTCRTLSYQDAQWRIPDFPFFELAPFDEGKIDQFIAAWYEDLKALGAVKAEESVRLAGALTSAIRRADLWRLAPNPLLLTVMALVHTHKGRLPDARALLYEDTIEILLWRWEEVKMSGETGVARLRQLLSEANRTDVDLKRTLWRLAFEAHRSGGAADGETLADIGELQLQTALAELHPEKSRDWAAEVIEAMKLRAGVLLERAAQVFTFPHRTFEEYLAGAHLAAQADFAAHAARLVAEGSFWREVILLAAGRLVYLSGDLDKPLALAAELCPSRAQESALAWRKAWLAGEILNEIGLQRAADSEFGRDLVERVRERLAALLRNGALEPVERAKAGAALGRLGDPRPGVGVKMTSDRVVIPDFDWIEIPPEPFLMGSTPKLAKYPDEEPHFKCQLIREPYRISRYPITVQQYRLFVEAKGYLERKYWTEAGWKWRASKNVTGPKEYGEVYQTPNHPQVGVSWYEAAAYCRWASEALGLPGLTIRLPREAEWERAARHTDGRIYPWGNEEEAPQRCNMGETGIGHTSAAGMFPTGNAECGAADMAGNVWEWCGTKWLGDYSDYERRVDEEIEGAERRVLRGGAFDYFPDDLRCAYRFSYYPNFRYRNFGFRVVASPF
jgi:formylglycine-generating enzyme required for sulfatase activity/energy-coupling factor transporter ATP-binding protein EcfA2